MKRVFLAALAVTFAGGIAWAASSVSMPSMWRYAHPDAKALVGVEWQRILRSPVGEEIRKKVAEADPAGLKDLNVLESVQRIFVSSPGKRDGDPEGQTAAVVAVQGNFDLEKIRELAAEKTTGSSTYEDIEILELQDKDGDPAALALVSSQLLLLGDPESVYAAIDHYRAGDPAQASDPLFQRAAELSAGNDIWIVAKTDPGDFAGDGKQPKFLQSVRSVEAGLSFQDGLGLRLNLGAEDAAKAQELAAGLKLILGMMLSGPQAQDSEGPNLAEKLQVSTEASRVKMALELKPDEVKQLFKKMTAVKVGPPQMAGSGQAPGTSAAPPPGPGAQPGVKIWGMQRQSRPAGDGKIRIYNAIGGTKVIDMSH